MDSSYFITLDQLQQITGSFAQVYLTRVTANDAKLTANTSNVTSAGALMDSELASIVDVKALDQSVLSGAPVFVRLT